MKGHEVDSVSVEALMAKKNPAMSRRIPRRIYYFLERIAHTEEIRAYIDRAAGLSPVGLRKEIRIESCKEKQMDWVELAKPVDPSAVMRELDETTLIGRFMNLSIHVVHGWEKPACMAEIGRIREQEFRAIGAGRNVERDIDDLDLLPHCYYQLVSWDPEHKELVSMYRFAKAGQVIANYGIRRLRTSTLFSFSDDFVRHVLSVSVELGRSVVNSNAHRAMAGLFAVWSGLSTLVREHPEIEYFFGNVTLSSSLSAPGRDAIVGFLNRFYSPSSYRNMVRAHPGLEYRFSTAVPDFSLDRTVAREELIDYLSKRGEAVPPILLSYLKAADDLAIFDTAKDGDFGDAWETAIAVPVKRLNEKTRRRFMDHYTREPGGYFDSERAQVAPIPLRL